MNNPTTSEDAHLTSNAGGEKAEVALWWNHVPVIPGERLGIVGRFSASGPLAAIDVLDKAVALLHQHGCTIAVGPMNGNTWQSYRFVTESTGEPPFFLEPSNPAEWPQWWEKFGFSSLANYYSAASENLSVDEDKLSAAAARVSEAGITLRTLRPDEFLGELERIYAVSAVSFRANYLYTPITREAFVSQYEPIREHVDPRLVLLAEKGGAPVGYIFAIPDLAQAKRGARVDTVIAKTMAVLPEVASIGLGGLLLGKIQVAARDAGYSRVIHALMHETNRSRRLSAHYAKSFRRYTLFSRRISG